MYFHPNDRHVNISGVGNHKITDRQLATFCVVIETDLGPVLGIFHNYAFNGEQVGTIHSQIQLISYGNFVCDKPRTGGGRACVRTPDGYTIPLCFRNGLPYMKQRLPTDEEMLTLPHVIMTADGDWDPCLHDDDHLSTQELLRRLPSTPIRETDDFYSP